MEREELRKKVSVIVPSFNMSKYLAMAIESFLKQTLDKKELILIDDGSSDSSLEIAESYARINCDIVIIKQNHKGAGAARNCGIQRAQGEYVCFLDADDFYASDDALEYLYRLAKRENAIICGGSSADYVDGIIRTEGLRKERKFLQEQYIQKENYPGVSGYWAFIFQKQFLVDNKVFFPDYLRGQDAPFFAKAIACAKKVYCSEKLVYIYRKQHKIVKFDEKKALDLAKSYRDVYLMSIEAHMANIQNVVEEELKGELGAIIYRYSYAGSKKMNTILKEINSIADKRENQKDKKKYRLLKEDSELFFYIQEVEKEKRLFITKLKGISRIYIFGAGIIGNKVAYFLEKNQFFVNAFIVSDTSKNPSVIRTIPVKSIEQIDSQDGDYIVIIATFWYSQQEIVNSLLKRNVLNVYLLELCKFFLWQEWIEH